MRSKRVIAGRGVGRTYTLPEHREACAEEFGEKSDALRPRTSEFWAINSKRIHT
jgi:hypothetical protein